MAIDPTRALTLADLEGHLWAAADLFRNKVSNQKDYILALLFFMRASDVYDEETAAALAELDGVPAAEELARDEAFHSLIIPAGHAWDDVRGRKEAELGEALNDALRAIARANPDQLTGVFEHTDFNDRRALPPADLAEILDHFNQLRPLSAARVPADMLGAAYEWLIAKFAAASGKAGGEFYTPAEVGRLCAALLAPEAGHDVYDPTCGSGGLLLQSIEDARRRGIDPTTISLFGQEINPETWALARMNMLLHGVGGQARIELGDTLANPVFRTGNRLRRFDRIVANPPFSSKNWGHDRFKAAGDPFGRIRHLPPKSHGELAFVQHMVASLAEGGRLAVVLPNGCFFRPGGELLVRKDLVEQDLIEAIVQLPRDMFYGAGIPACILVCSRAKPAERAGRILLIDASDAFERRGTKNVLRDDDIKKITDTFTSGAAEEGWAVWVSPPEIAAQNYNLSVSRRVRGSNGNGALLSLDEAIKGLREAQRKRAIAERRLEDVLSSLEREG